MPSNDNQATRNWYIRQSAQVHGPFTVGHVQREILLGRVAPSDEISHDQQTWTRIDEHPELIPTVMKADLSDPLARDRLAAARRWADDGEHAHGTLSEQLNYDHDEDHESGSIISRKLEQNRHRQWQNRVIFLLLFMVILIVYYQYFSTTTPVKDTPVECTNPPVAGMDLSNCFLQNSNYPGLDMRRVLLMNANLNGANLQGSNLQSANLSYSLLMQANLEQVNFRDAELVGVDFTRANLRQVDFSGADLSYANLLSADIRGAQFKGAKLDNARMPDGTICSPGAVSVCQ